MTISEQKNILIGSLLFILGLSIGVTSVLLLKPGHRKPPHRKHEAPIKQRVDRITSLFTEKLNLNSEQQQKVKSIIHEEEVKMEELSAKRKTHIQFVHQQIKELLDVTQMPYMLELEKEMKLSRPPNHKP